MSKHLGTMKVARHEVRFVFDLEARGGMYSPELHAYISGPNGSVLGFGPKGWPRWLVGLFPPSYAPGTKWSSMLAIRIPHVRWRYVRNPRLRRLRNVVYQANYRLLRRTVS